MLYQVFRPDKGQYAYFMYPLTSLSPPPSFSLFFFFFLFQGLVLFTDYAHMHLFFEYLLCRYLLLLLLYQCTIAGDPGGRCNLKRVASGKAKLGYKPLTFFFFFFFLFLFLFLGMKRSTYRTRDRINPVGNPRTGEVANGKAQAKRVSACLCRTLPVTIEHTYTIHAHAHME